MLEEVTYSYIKKDEEDEAKNAIIESLGFEVKKVLGNFLAIKIYERDENLKLHVDENGKPILDSFGMPKALIVLPPMLTTHDRFTSCVGLVVAMGDDCYKSERFKESGAWCKVGDFVVFPRQVGSQENYRGIPVMIIEDKEIISVIENPEYIEKELFSF